MWHKPLIPALRRQRQTDLCEFKASLVYTRLIQSKREKEPGSGDGIWLGREKNIRQEETGAHCISAENSWKQDLAHTGLRIQQR